MCPVAKQGSGSNAVSDQWIEPFVITDGDDKAVGTIEDGDAVVIFNFRADRVVEISKAFEYEDFTAFNRRRFPKVPGMPQSIARETGPYLTLYGRPQHRVHVN